MSARILVTDDDPFSLKITSLTLTKAGYQVSTAQNGAEALELVGQIKPDLIILDVMMPGMDGYQVCRNLRKRPELAHLPIMMLTANDSLEQKIQGFQAGTDDYLVKPFQPDELILRVEALLRRTRLIAPAPTVQVENRAIGFFSLRGGVGISTLAVNVALALTQIWDLPTTLIDLALVCGQSALLLNVPLRNTWADLAHVPQDELTIEVVEQALLEHPSGLHILAAPPNPEEGELVTAELVGQVIDLLKRQNHYLVFDLPHNFQDTTLAALDRIDQLVVVVTPEIGSIYSTRHLFETLRTLNYRAQDICVLLNWTFPKQGLARADIERALGHAVDLILPYATEPLITAINLGEPPVLKPNETGIGALLQDIAFLLSKETHRKQKPEHPTQAWKEVIARQQRQAKR